jgi:flagellar protein FliO/FliZ
MKNFTGLHKKFIAGFHCGIFLLVLLPNCIVWAAEPITNNESSPVSSQLAPGDSPVPINSNASPNATANTDIATTSPVNAPKPAVTNANSASQLASVIGGLAIILVLIYGLSWFVKRFAQGGFTQNPAMKIICSMPLGTRERLMLVDVGGKQLLLGVTASQINTLHVFDEPVVVGEKTQPVASEFSQKLMAIIQKNHTQDTSAQKNQNS